MKLKYLILTLLLIGCTTEPRPTPVFINREVEVTDTWLEFNGSGSRAIDFPWGYGVVVFGVGVNRTDKAWYGKPQVNVYTTDEPAAMDSTWENGDLIKEEKGWWTTGTLPWYVTIDTLFQVPANSFRIYVAVTPVDKEKVDTYIYATVSFHAEGGPGPGW